MTPLCLYEKVQLYLRNPPQETWLAVGSWVWQKEPQIYSVSKIPFKMYPSETKAMSEATCLGGLPSAVSP